MSVRSYSDCDFPSVCRIYAQAKEDELRFEGGVCDIIPLPEDPGILAAFRQSTVLVFEDREVLGFAALYENQLRALFVCRGARGKGVGQALLDAALAQSTDALMLCVAKSNADALGLYQRNGFVAIGEADRTYHGMAVAYWQMQLDPAARGNR